MTFYVPKRNTGKCFARIKSSQVTISEQEEEVEYWQFGSRFLIVWSILLPLAITLTTPLTPTNKPLCLVPSPLVPSPLVPSPLVPPPCLFGRHKFLSGRYNCLSGRHTCLSVRHLCVKLGSRIPLCCWHILLAPVEGRRPSATKRALWALLSFKGLGGPLGTLSSGDNLFY